MEKELVAIRFVTNDVAIAHVVLHTSGGDVPMPDGKKADPTNGMALLVYVKQNGKWLMAAGENVIIDKGAQPYDPLKQMRKTKGN